MLAKFKEKHRRWSDLSVKLNFKLILLNICRKTSKKYLIESPYKHATFIPRWKDVEMVVSLQVYTSLEHGAYAVCLQGYGFFFGSLFNLGFEIAL